MINGLIERFATQNVDVIYIVHEWTNPILRFLTRNAAAKGTVGAEIDSRLKVVGSLKFWKSSASSFTNKEFEQYLRSKGITHLYVTGLAAEYCVKATIKDGLKKGYVITAVSDGIAAKKCKNLERNLKKYKERGAEVLLSSNLAERFGGYTQRH